MIAPAYHSALGATLYVGDAIDVLQDLPTNSVDCVVTSPPYWRLRDYGTQPDRQYSLEATATDYIDTLRRVFTELDRVLTRHGVAWLNLGDSYSTNSDGYQCTKPGQPGQPARRPVADVPHRNLLGMPWRVAHALHHDGWLIRDAIVWHKPNATPTPVRDRLACRYELLVHLQPATATTWHRHRHDRGWGGVWSIPTCSTTVGHPAVFPVEVPLRCIAASCRPGARVLDPFSGTATTGLAAQRLGHPYIGIDLNPTYVDIAARRLGLPSRTGEPVRTVR